MSHSSLIITKRGTVVDYCPSDGTRMILVKIEDHTSYGGGYYLYFLECQNKHKWLLTVTQYDECPPTLISEWKTKVDKG